MKSRIINIALVLVSGILISGCYGKEHITAELGKPRHEIKDSNDPLDKKIFNIYSSTGVAILYNYTELDYKWNLSSTSFTDFVLVKQTDRAVIENGIKYLDKVLFDYYDLNFKKKYFPLNFLLCDTLKNLTTKDLITLSGRNFMAIGKISRGVELTPDVNLNTAKGVINGALWGNHIYINGLMEFPADFFSPCEELYTYKIGTKTDTPPFDAKKLGFWDKDPETSTTSTYMAPKKQGDINQFIQQITSSTYQEMMTKMNGYPILYNKYIILTTFFKEKYNIDLQAIGNNKPTQITLN